MPGKVGGLTDVVKSASFATAVGLLLYGWDQKKHLFANQNANEDMVSESLQNITTKIKGFFESLF
jgi:cell division ATPase FtsA